MTTVFQEKGALYISLICLMAGTILTIPMEQPALGYSILAAGLALLGFVNRSTARHIGLIFVSVALIGLTPISTNLELTHFATMGTLLVLAVLVPLIVTRHLCRESIIHFPFGRHAWTKQNISYLVLALVLAYLLLPLWMQTTGDYHNWTVIADPYHLVVLFIGTNSLGIWDELFFIVTVLSLLRKHLPFYQANFVQAVLFTSFLYELGFRGWAPIGVFFFALLQGIVFYKTDNLLYVILVHLKVDLILYLALINAHYPHLVDIFLI